MTTPTTLHGVCSEYIDTYFENHPFTEVRQLKDFETGKGLLIGFLKPGINIKRRLPKKEETHEDTNKPSLLLHGLQNSNENKVHRFIDETKKHCSGLYGTSGAGKTRGIYEYLSRNFGLYFVAETENDPGSMDFKMMIDWFAMHQSEFRLSNVGNSGALSSSSDDDSSVGSSSKETKAEKIQKQKESLSVQNYDKMNTCIQLLIHIRNLVFISVKRQLREKRGIDITPYDWLLIQLFPHALLGKDLFKSAVRKGLQHIQKNGFNDKSVFENLMPTNGEDDDDESDDGNWLWSVMVVDEAQEIQKKLPDFFLSTTVKKTPRYAFSAVLKSMCHTLTALGMETGFPLVAGTGLSFEDIRAAHGSVMVKNPLDEKEYIFTQFEPLTKDNVEKYILQFLEIDLNEKAPEDQSNYTTNRSVLDHLCKWLRGRPRWTASFLEVYLVREFYDDYKGTRGSFSKVGSMLMQALDRFLDVYTTKSIEHLPGENRRNPFKPSHGSAYSAIERSIKESKYSVNKTLENAIFKYVVGGQAVPIDAHYRELIEIGIAAISIDEKRKAVIDEPIIIQAGINYFSLSQGVIDNNGFEEVMLPAIQKRFPEILRQQLGAEDIKTLSDKSLPLRSAYGVLALKCKSPEDTMDWIERAAKATFEGQIVPFCYPDNKIGPDLIFLIWNSSFSEHVFVISQAKYRKNVSQLSALRTITPSLLYYEKRDKVPVPSNVLQNNNLKDRWENDVKPKIVGEGSNGCVRFMVQYPDSHTRSAKAGVLEDNEIKVGQNSRRPAKRRKLGWLATVSGSNADTLFEKGGLEVLSALKDN